MATKPVALCSHNPMLGATSAILEELTGLNRLMHLQSVLPFGQNRRQKITQQLDAVWKAPVTELSRMQASLQEGLEKINPKIGAVYAAQIQSATSLAELEGAIQQFAQDTLTSHTPIQKSISGIMGPTLLASYLKLVDSRFLRAEEYVIKWTKNTEVVSTHLYDAFSRCLTSGAPASTFAVPKIASIDLKHAIHERADRSRVTLTAEQIDLLREKFFQVTKQTGFAKPSKLDTILLSDKIAGSNFSDFAITKYPLLPGTQKEKLFIRLGRLALIDLVMGNTDRLIQTFEHQGKYCLENIPSNLDNVMLVWSPDMKLPELYAIDNGIDELLIYDSVHREMYLTFLSQLCSQSTLASVLTVSIIESMQAAVGFILNDDYQKLEGQLAPLNQDLATIARGAICSGIEEMAERLQTTFIPRWNAPEASFIKDYLGDACPELLTAVSERLETFQLARSQWLSALSVP